jgi:hypothetical protein
MGKVEIINVLLSGAARRISKHVPSKPMCRQNPSRALVPRPFVLLPTLFQIWRPLLTWPWSSPALLLHIRWINNGLNRRVVFALIRMLKRNEENTDRM